MRRDENKGSAVKMVSSLCSKRSAGEHTEITEEPIGAWLLFNRKPIISCGRTTPERVISFPTFLITYGK